MSYPYYPIVELAFYENSTFTFYTKPDWVFLVAGLNGPPILSLSESNMTGASREIANWAIYPAKDFPNNQCGYNERILKLCILMLGLFVEQEKELIMVAEGFSKDILDTRSKFDTYRKLSRKQLSFLIKLACKTTIPKKYRVLSYCLENIDIIQDIQKKTGGLHLEQYRYRERIEIPH